MTSPLIKQVFVTKARSVWINAVSQQAQGQDWLDFFSNHAKVKLLRFTPLEHVADALSFLASAMQDQETSSPPMLPKLRKLSFRQFFPKENFTSTMLSALATALVSRQMMGVPIATLEYLKLLETGQSEFAGIRKSFPRKVTEVVERHGVGLEALESPWFCV